jgi:hypothetical protein
MEMGQLQALTDLSPVNEAFPFVPSGLGGPKNQPGRENRTEMLSGPTGNESRSFSS